MEIFFDIQGMSDSYSGSDRGEIAVQRLTDSSIASTIAIFDPPCSWTSLSPENKSVNVWCYRNCHGTCAKSGNVKYRKLVTRLFETARDVSYIYVKGKEKKKWLESVMGKYKPIIDLENWGCPPLQTIDVMMPLSSSHPLRHSSTFTTFCSVVNVARMRKWYIENKYDTSSMKKSMQLYNLLGTLETMKTEDINELPKEFILKYAFQDINGAWDHLPENFQRDERFINYQRCNEHYDTFRIDVNDGPIPYKYQCSQCMKNEE